MELEREEHEEMRIRGGKSNSSPSQKIWSFWPLMGLILSGLVYLSPDSLLGSDTPPKGLLRELQEAPKTESDHLKKEIQSEVLVTRAEQKAIVALEKIIKKKRGSPEEPDLWYRLGELYLRRAKSGRFFDMNREEKMVSVLSPPQILSQTANENLKKAIDIFEKIQREFPRFSTMDYVIFNQAFSSQQIGEKKRAKELYELLIVKYPKSDLIPDARLIVGEIYYESQEFDRALVHFEALDQFPKSNVYSYGVYKRAWTLYNLKKNAQAIDSLVFLVRYHDPKKAVDGRKLNHNLRTEALRDLTLFAGETYSAPQVYSFFADLCSSDEKELGEAVIQTAKIYESYSREKDMVVFLQDFISKNPESSYRVKAHIYMIQSYEVLKNRKELLRQLEITSNLCENPPFLGTESCQKDLAHISLDLSKKWWEIWQKNKAHKEFTELTEQIFSIYLSRPSIEKVDIKTRYAFAEFLFQSGQSHSSEAYFRKASHQYERVGDLATDPQIQHDAHYGALVSLQKAMESTEAMNQNVSKDQKLKDDEEMCRLGGIYLQYHPKGPHAVPVKFKMGLLAYEKKNYDESEKWLIPLAGDGEISSGGNFGDLKRKSEDLLLDIFNVRKDFPRISSFAEGLKKQILKSGSKKDLDLQRVQQLEKIIQEAQFSEIQVYVKSKESHPIVAAQRFLSFAQTHTQSPLAQEGLWQALSLLYKTGWSLDGARLSLYYVNLYPKDPKSIDALKEAGKRFAEAGDLLTGAQTLERVAQRVPPQESSPFWEASKELYLLVGDKDKVEKIVSDLASTGHEPYVSRLHLKRVQSLYEKKKMTEAFQAAKTLINSSRPIEIRAGARFIQAQILEAELEGQSTKTSLDRLPTVIGIKLEKLDKAQTAYSNSSKMDPKNITLQVSSLEGLIRCYKNSISSLQEIKIKDNLSEEEKKALGGELAKVTGPLEEKLKTTEDLLKEVKGAERSPSLAVSNGSGFSLSPEELEFFSHPSKESLRDQSMDGKTCSSFLPLVDWSPGTLTKLIDPQSSSSLDELSQKTKICLIQKQWVQARNWSLEISRSYPDSRKGLYFLGVAEALQGHKEASDWFIGKYRQATTADASSEAQKGK